MQLKQRFNSKCYGTTHNNNNNNTTATHRTFQHLQEVADFDKIWQNIQAKIVTFCQSCGGIAVSSQVYRQLEQF